MVVAPLDVVGLLQTKRTLPRLFPRTREGNYQETVDNPLFLTSGVRVIDSKRWRKEAKIENGFNDETSKGLHKRGR